MLHIPSSSEGRLETLEFDSELLKNNPLGDPSRRKLAVWLPPEYDATPERRFPVLFALAGYLSSGLSMTSWRGFDENLPERAARLVHSGAMPPAILVFPDCFTSLGGNQYLDSSAIGCYGSYVARELVPLVDNEFHTLKGREHRGVFGHSSGGFGALWQAMTYPDVWGAAASHAGDMGFECCYLPGWMKTLTTLSLYKTEPYAEGKVQPPCATKDIERGCDDGRVKNFLDAMRGKAPDFNAGHALMDVAMAASYDPDPAAPNGFRLPFELETGELLPERWKRWQACDPVKMAAGHADALRSLRALYIDSGWRDQYAMHFGARQLVRELARLDVPCRYEQFDGTHSNSSWRYDVSLPLLAKALS